MYSRVATISFVELQVGYHSRMATIRGAASIQINMVPDYYVHTLYMHVPAFLQTLQLSAFAQTGPCSKVHLHVYKKSL